MWFIKVDDDNLEVLEEIQIDPEKFIGKEIELCGFICKENYLKNTHIFLKLY